ncbi:uncharacterized protein N7496_004437 [Penicillium cataractarum]|uniref:Altered inheritance of mitochondria protein 9, mitochondrial n=1 Tax=Penicillium cataractarum TaxID=2100454 RepID=A0A9W9SR74_9EURO|nr:uncharacterized protein N7496_004437 [Penicillium cataractarum]KAJ5382009.1 hypothetical protein N7496_004437 [Penicillium cataractarum]
MDDDSCVVARLPTSIAGPPRLTTNSEVATMTYLRSRLTLPISRVLDWSDDPSNPIGTEYIIQEPVTGAPLHQLWPTMTSEQHMLCTKALSLAMKEMASLDFPAYGSLYFSDAPLDSARKIHLEKSFCIGPHCGSIYWNRGPREIELYGDSSPDCGPWKNLERYCQGLIQTGFSRLPKYAINNELLPHQGSNQEHIRLLNTSQSILQHLIEDTRVQESATPTLLHPDFHMRNIYVSIEDPTVLTGLIDWQSTSIEPAFTYVNQTPDFASIPEDFEEDTFQDERDPKQKQKEYKDALIYICIKGFAPKLRPARLLDESLFQLFRYSHTSWRDSATALRQDIIDLSSRWDELGVSSSCPFSPSREELGQHARDYEDLEIVRGLKRWLRRSLGTNSDGWVENEGCVSCGL